MTTHTDTDNPTILDSDGRRVIAWGFPASKESVAKVMSAEVGADDGRSDFKWLRLENGDLMLGVFPRGATYEDVEVDAQLPPNALDTDDLRIDNARPIKHEIRSDMDYLRDEHGVSVVFFRMPEHNQLYVGINTEDAPYDNDKDGEPILQVMLNDASLYDRERPKHDRFMGPEGGPYQLRCTFRPQRDVAPGRPMTDVEDIDPTVLGRAWHELTWIAEYDEAPSEQRTYGSDALRDHPDVPQWIKDWDGPFEIEFQVRYTVVGLFEGHGGEAARYAEAFWADNPKHAEEQAKDSARASGESVLVTAVLYGEAQVAA